MRNLGDGPGQAPILHCTTGKEVSEQKHQAPQNKASLSLKAFALHFLLVEDNAIALKVLESMITKAGHQVTSALDGTKALELVKTKHFDLMITDIGLPDISGFELVQSIRAWENQTKLKPIPIFGLSGHAVETSGAECLASGMNGVFQKPFNSAILEELLDQYAKLKQL